MPNAKRIHFETRINAPVEQVWQVMLGPETYKLWTSAFCEGSYYEGSWDQGETIHFLSPGGNGMVAQIAENRRNEFISIQHQGMINDGVVDRDSEAVRAWAPAFENYSFRAVGGGTELAVDMDVTQEWEGFMQETWPKALGKLKELCEQ